MQNCGGAGRKRRSRYCIDPPPEHGGRPCEGYGVQTQRCTTGTSSLIYYPTYFIRALFFQEVGETERKSREDEKERAGSGIS